MKILRKPLKLKAQNIIKYFQICIQYLIHLSRVEMKQNFAPNANLYCYYLLLLIEILNFGVTKST